MTEGLEIDDLSGHFQPNKVYDHMIPFYWQKIEFNKYVFVLELRFSFYLIQTGKIVSYYSQLNVCSECID